MRKILFLLLVCVYGSYSSAQLFTLHYIADDETGEGIVLGQEIPNGSKLTVSEFNFARELFEEAFITNISDKKVNLKIVAYREKLTEGSTEAFCYGVCYPFDAAEERNYPPTGTEIELEPEEGGDMSFHCVPGEEGDNIVRYEFYDDNDPSNDRFILTIVYNADATGISVKESGSYINTIPCGNGETSLNYSFTTDRERVVKIYNIAGNVIETVSLNSLQGEFTLNLNKGIYFYSLTEEARVAETKKFIVY